MEYEKTVIDENQAKIIVAEDNFHGRDGLPIIVFFN